MNHACRVYEGCSKSLCQTFGIFKRPSYNKESICCSIWKLSTAWVGNFDLLRFLLYHDVSSINEICMKVPHPLKWYIVFIQWQVDWQENDMAAAKLQGKLRSNLTECLIMQCWNLWFTNFMSVYYASMASLHNILCILTKMFLLLVIYRLSQRPPWIILKCFLNISFVDNFTW